MTIHIVYKIFSIIYAYLTYNLYKGNILIENNLIEISMEISVLNSPGWQKVVKKNIVYVVGSS